MTTPYRLDLDDADGWIVKEDRYDITITCYQDTAQSTLYDFTGWTLGKMVVKEKYNSAGSLFCTSVDGGSVVLGGTVGTIAVGIPGSVTSDFTWIGGTKLYYIMATDDSSEEHQLCYGKIRCVERGRFDD